MGGTLSVTRTTTCENPPSTSDEKLRSQAEQYEAPPVMQRPMSFEEKLYAKVSSTESDRF